MRIRRVLLYNSTLGLYGSSQTVADVDAIQVRRGVKHILISVVWTGRHTVLEMSSSLIVLEGSDVWDLAGAILASDSYRAHMPNQARCDSYFLTTRSPVWNIYTPNWDSILYECYQNIHLQVKHGPRVEMLALRKILGQESDLGYSNFLRLVIYDAASISGPPVVIPQGLGSPQNVSR
eukprot:scaffold4081_cov19-Tisochrysis_lutea.AAC.1